MLEKFRKTSFLLSSNWYKRYKIPYLILIVDIFFVLLFAVFSVKDYLVGYFDGIYKFNGILILIIISILLIVRFNISLLMFSKQRFGLYLSILFLLTAISIELIFDDLYSPFMLVFESVILFINTFIIELPDFLNTLIVYIFYIFSLYGPILYYSSLHLRKKNLSNSASVFDIMTGFYGTTLSKRLKIMDMVIYCFLIGIAMTVGLVSENINWMFLSVPISLYAIYEFFNRMYFPHLNKKKKIIIYLLTFLISTLVMFTQKLPYYGLIFFAFSVLFMFTLLTTMTKSPLRSIAVTVFSFIIIPIFCMGYNLFAFPQYGIIAKSVPYENEKIFYHIVDQDGNLGFRNRRLKILRPAYTKIIYCQKNCIKLLNKNSVWETYTIPDNELKKPKKYFDLFKTKNSGTFK